MSRHRISINHAGAAVALGLVVLAAVLMAGCTGENGSIVSMGVPAPTSTYNSTLPDGVTVTKPSRSFTSTRPSGASPASRLATTQTRPSRPYSGDELKSGKVIFRHINLQNSRRTGRLSNSTGHTLVALARCVYL